jgi:peptidoglycan/LPS O-acetylase OafA/YrhL
MRALAVGLVVLFHVGVPWIPGGYIGVDVFFVISGFLITRLLLTERLATGRIRLGNFYIRRARRLLPALALVVIATLVASWWLLGPLSRRELGTDANWAALYAANFRFMSVELDYFALDQHVSPLLHLWSLAVEEQFYLLWPALIMLLMFGRTRITGRVAGGLTLVVVASLVASVVMTSNAPSIAYFSPLTRLWELGLGALLAVFAPVVGRIPRRWCAALSWVGLVAIVWAAIQFTEATPFPGIAALVPVGGATLLIATSRRGSVVHRLLSIRPMQYLGRISYSVYLWHWPLIAFALVQWDNVTLPMGIAIVAATIALADASYRFVEHPIRSGEFFRSSRVVALTTVAITASVLTLGWGIAASSSIEGSGAEGEMLDLQAAVDAGSTETRLQLDAALNEAVKVDALPRNVTPTLEESVDDAPRIYEDECHVPRGDISISPECVYGDTRSNVGVALFGDSHAAHWFPALEAGVDTKRMRIVNFTKSSCPSIDLVPDLEPGVPYDACEQWREHVLKRLESDSPRVVLLGFSWSFCTNKQDTRSTCTSALERMIEQVQGAAPSAKILVLEDTAQFAERVPECLAESPDDMQRCAGNRREVVPLSLSKQLRRAAEGANAEYISTSDWLCTDTKCPPVIGNTLIYRDSSHLSVAAAEWLAPLLNERVKRASSN